MTIKIKERDPNSKVKIIGKDIPSEYILGTTQEDLKKILKSFIEVDNKLTL